MGQSIVFPVRLSADKENGHSNNEMMMVLFYKFKEKLGILSSIRNHRKKSRETRESPTPADILVNI